MTGDTCRVNGWGWPLHPLQVVAWFFIIFFTLMTIFLIAPSFMSQWQPVAYVCIGVFLLAHVITNVICVSMNPADPNLRDRMRKGKVAIAVLDRTVHRRAIENQHCYVCEVDVGPKTKHCGACNKCIGNFDHHCYWLNNCVGSRNYKVFLVTLASALFGTIIIFILCLVLFIAYFTDKASGNILKAYYDVNQQSSGVFWIQDSVTPGPPSPTFQFFYGTIPGELWLTLVLLTAVFALATITSVGYLFGFHLNLIWKGMSTYDYIVWQREKEEIKSKSETPTKESVIV